jgi:phage gpG-like protein
MISSVEELIAVLGGNSGVAGIANVGSSAVSNWRKRGFIPADKFLLFEQELAKRNMVADREIFGFEARA